MAFLFVKGFSKSLDVDHHDFNKLNNYYKNLKYKTKAENTRHSAVHGRLKGRKWRQKNITIQFDLNGNKIKEYSSLSEAAIAVNGRKGMISRAIIGRSHTAYGFKWGYKI